MRQALASAQIEGDTLPMQIRNPESQGSEGFDSRVCGDAGLIEVRQNLEPVDRFFLYSRKTASLAGMGWS
jgi:hypothetical protein